MTKCDFCRYSNPDGSCPYSSVVYRSGYCKEAVEHMTDAMGGSDEEKDKKKKKKKGWF